MSNSSKLSFIFRASTSASKLVKKQKKATTSAATTTSFSAEAAKITKGSSKSARRSSTQPNSSEPIRDIDELPGQLKQMGSILWENSKLDSYSANTLTSNNYNSASNSLDIPWFGDAIANLNLRRKEVCRLRKQKWVFKKGQGNRFDQLVKMCGNQLGVDATLQIFGKLGRETGLKEYNALLGLCIEEARETDDEEVRLDQNYKAYQLFQAMREMGFQLDEETYGPFLEYLIDFGMVQEFYFFSDIFEHESTASLPRLAYYEMRLCIRMNNEDKIQELLYENALYDGDDKFIFQESYLLALCESDRRREVLMLLQTFDVTKVLPVQRLGNMFRSLGKLLLEPYAEKFLLVLKIQDTEAEIMSSIIYDYAISIPNLVVEDVVSKFKQLHSELEVTPTSEQYEKLVKHSCELLKVHVALDIADEIFNVGFTLSPKTFQSIMDACEKSCEYNLVRRIYSMIQRQGLKPTDEMFRSMINLSVRMKDFEGAYNLISDLVEMNMKPTAGMYNAIMVGYFREKNTLGAFTVLRQMQDANVEPDAQTFSYLIGNCSSEEGIIKIIDEKELHCIPDSRNIYMALINAYAASGQFEKAKQVVLDKRIPKKILNEVKSVLVSALASHGKLSDALTVYKEIKQAKSNLEPKAVMSLIEHLQSKGQLDRLLKLLEELQDPKTRVDGCFRVLAYCVTHNHLRPAIDLLKQIKDEYSNDEVVTENLFDEVFCQFAEKDPKSMKLGLGLLRAIKEELGLCPSRKCLDFLLSACISAKDLQTALFIWEEYQIAELPYNVLSFVRMYQTLLALGEYKSAANILNKIPKDDPHVCSVIKACKATYIYSKTAAPKGTKKKKKKKKSRDNELLTEAVKVLDGSELG